MTIEEAVEVILGSEAWIKCLSCGGRSYIVEPHGFTDCSYCLGRGYTINNDYLTACMTLNREPPPCPQAGSINFSVFEIIDIPAVINECAVRKLTIK